MENKKRIIFIHFFNSFSGSPLVLKSVIESLKCHDVTLVTNKTDGFLTGLEINYKYFNFNLSKNRIKTFIYYFLGQFSIFWIVLWMVKKNDLLYVNTAIPVFAAFAGRIKGAIILFHLHEDRRSLNFIHQSVSFFRRFFCDYEIFVSKYLFKQEHIEGKKFYILPNVLSKDFSDKVNSKILNESSNSIFNVLMICSLKPYKGVFEFLKIAKGLLEEKDISFTLVVSESKDEIESFFADSTIPSNTRVYGKTTDTISYYEQASVVLNLSRVDEWIETFGLTILEGMTFGLPCIVPPVGGPDELIIEGINGFKISSYETDNIIYNILNLKNDKTLYNTLSLNSKSRALDFQFESFKRNIQAIVNEI
jgi:glycosyltransferase involved in cell wall biosynthesis